jgi:hypothetical protein
MRLRGFVVVAALAAAQLGVAFAQQAVANSPTRPLSGINLSFDAPHGQLTASGYAVRTEAAPASGTPTVSGTVNVTITINLISYAGTNPLIPCSVIVLGGEWDTSTPVVDGGINTASGDSLVDTKTKTATCTLSIPYEWTVPTESGVTKGLFVGFAVASVVDNVTIRSTIQMEGLLPLPSTGTTTNLTYTTSL